MKPNSIAILLAGASLGLAACAQESSAPVEGDGLRIAVAPLSLPGITDACYDLAVYNTTAASPSSVVWSRDEICSSRFGDGAGSVTYIGTCDAGVANDNLVTLVLTGLYAGGSAPTGTAVPTTEYVNPCPSATPCELLAPCAENQDTLVEFNLTIMRNAGQGFFDVAVNFEDIFCSAKVDCQTAGGADLMLSFDPVTGERIPAVVLALACTAGPGTDTHLWIDGPALVCADGTTTLPIANDPPGNVYSATSPAPAPLSQITTFRGREQLTGPGGVDYAKVYANLTIGVDKAGIDSDCRLVATMTASDGPFTPPFTTPAATTYPLIEVDVPLWAAATQDFVCTQHPLNDPDAPAGEGVFTSYTSTTQPHTFTVAIRREGDGVVVETPPITAGVAGHVFEGLTADETWSNQPGVSGVTVRVYSDAALTTLVGSVVTGASGAYDLGLPDGSYWLHVTPAELTAAGYGNALTNLPVAFTVSGSVVQVDVVVQRRYEVRLRFFEGDAYDDVYDGSQPFALDVPFTLNDLGTGLATPRTSVDGEVVIALAPGYYALAYDQAQLLEAGYRWDRWSGDWQSFEVIAADLVVDVPLDPLLYTTMQAQLFVSLDGDITYTEGTDVPLSAVDIIAYDQGRVFTGPTVATGAEGWYSNSALYLAGNDGMGNWDISIDQADPDFPLADIDVLQAQLQHSATAYQGAADPYFFSYYGDGAWPLTPARDRGIEATAWYDVNRDGTLDPGDPILGDQSFFLDLAYQNPDGSPYRPAAWIYDFITNDANNYTSTTTSTRWEGLRPWTYRLSLNTTRAPLSSGASVVSSDGDTANVVLPFLGSGIVEYDFLVAPGAASLELYLGDTESGMGGPYPNVTVTLSPDLGPIGGSDWWHWETVAPAIAPRQVVTGANGRATFTNVVPGAYLLEWNEADIPGYPSTTQRDFVGGPSRGLLVSGVVSQSAHYARYQSIRVTAVDIDNNTLVAGVQVTIDNTVYASQSGTTGGAGEHIFLDSVRAGIWDVSVDSVPSGWVLDPLWSGCQLLVVPGGGGYECVVPLVIDAGPALGDLEGYAYLADSAQLLANVQVDLYDASMTFIDSYYTDEMGYFVFYDLPEGDYHVDALPSDFDRNSQVMSPDPYVVTGGVMSTVEVRVYPFAPTLSFDVLVGGVSASGLSISSDTELTFSVTATPSLYLRYLEGGYITVECVNYEYGAGSYFDLEYSSHHLRTFNYSVGGTAPTDPAVPVALHQGLTVNEGDAQLAMSYTQSTFALWDSLGYEIAQTSQNLRTTDCSATWYDASGTVIATSGPIAYNPYYQP